MQILTNFRRIALLIFIMVILPGVVKAQEITITGKVSAEGGEALPGVQVTVKTMTVRALTDQNGAYTIFVPDQAPVLVFSSYGYITQEITISALTVIDVVLVKDLQSLYGKVVTGYTAQPERDITGSVAVVDPDRLTAIPAGNVSNQLQGRLAGINVIGNGQPGTTSRVRIRGFSSFLSNDPLYIIDGVPAQDISSMNPNDIESLCVLKDAGAASVYGSRASGGVIVITTRKGSNGVRVTYDMYYGTQSPGKGPSNLLNSEEYANLQWLVYKNDGTVEIHPIYGSSVNPEPTLPNWAANTNWYDAITDRAGIRNHDLTFSGGNERAKFFAGLGYFKQEGIILHTHAQKYTGRFNSEWTFLHDRVKVGENLTFAYRENLGVANLSEDSPIQMGPYRSQSIIPVKITQPIAGPSHNYMPGEWGGTGIAPRLGNAGNVVANLTRDKDDKFHNIHLIGSGYIDVMLMKGLNFRSTFGGTWDNGYGVNYTQATYENAENILRSHLIESAYWGSDWVWTNALTVDRTLGRHKIVAVAGYEAVKYDIGRNVSGQRAGYFSDAVDFRTLSNGAATLNTSSSSYTPTKLVSTFLKADYGFMEKYLLGFTVRRDGCSRFGMSNRYGMFPSFSAGWRISNEPFLNGIKWINDLKIRGSYGTTGNQFAVSPMYSAYLFTGDVRSSFYDLNGTGNSAVPGFFPLQIGNPGIKWETSETVNIGIETQLLNGKVNLIFDWYSKKSKDLIFAAILPGTAGGTEYSYVNVAAMQNSGIDMELSYQHAWGDLGFNGSFVFTTYHNEITKITNGVDYFTAGNSRIGSIVRNEAGHPLSAFYGYEVAGLFRDDDEVNAAPYQDGAEPGFFRFADIDTTTSFGFQYINSNDRTFIGNPNPKFTYGLNLALTCRNFDLSAFIYGSQGNDIFNWNRWWTDFWPSFQGQKSSDLLNNSWTPHNTGASTPKASNKSNFSTNTQVCSYYIENGSYLRLKSLQLGYTIPEKLTDKIHISSFRVYVQAVNLFTITKYSGLDPELGGSDLSFGIDYGNYPNAKQFIFGINVTL